MSSQANGQVEDGDAQVIQTKYHRLYFAVLVTRTASLATKCWDSAAADGASAPSAAAAAAATPGAAAATAK